MATSALDQSPQNPRPLSHYGFQPESPAVDSVSSSSSWSQNDTRGIAHSHSTDPGPNNLQQSVFTLNSSCTPRKDYNYDTAVKSIGQPSARHAPEPVHHEMPSTRPKRPKRSERQRQPTNAPDVAISLRHTLRYIDHHRRLVQRLRNTAREVHQRRKTTIPQLSAATSSLLKVLEGETLPAELCRKISGHVLDIKRHVKEVEDQEVSFDSIQNELDPAEWTLKQNEISLYEQVRWPIELSESEADTMHGDLAGILHGGEGQSLEPEVQNPDIARVPSPIPLQSKIREEVLMPLEFMHTETVQELASHSLRLDPRGDGQQTMEAGKDIGTSGEVPPYMESLVAGPNASEDRPMAAVAGRLSRLLVREAHAQNQLSQIQADYASLQEDAHKRLAVGVPLDTFSQEYLEKYPQTCALLQKELADIQAETIVCKQLEAQVPRMSRAFFHTDQFATVSTNNRPTELVIDDEEDLETQWETYEALARDLWPVSTTISYPKHTRNWMSMTLDIMRTRREILYAYVSFWLLKCLQASWLSFSRFIYIHYLDDVFPPNNQSLRKRLLQSWFDKDLTISVRRLQSKLPGHPGPLSLLTVGSALDEKDRKQNTSRWSVGAQVDAILTPRKSATSRKRGHSLRQMARTVTRSVLSGSWRPRDDYPRTL